MVIFSKERVVPEHDMTCDAPAQSFTYRDPISNPPYALVVRTLEDSDTSDPTTILPTESSQNIAAFLAEPL